MILNKTKELQKRIVAYHVVNGNYPKQIRYGDRTFTFDCNFDNVIIYDNTDNGRDFIFVKIDYTILNCLDRLENTFKDFDDTISEDFMKDFKEEYDE